MQEYLPYIAVGAVAAAALLVVRTVRNDRPKRDHILRPDDYGKLNSFGRNMLTTDQELDLIAGQDIYLTETEFDAIWSEHNKYKKELEAKQHAEEIVEKQRRDYSRDLTAPNYVQLYRMLKQGHTLSKQDIAMEFEVALQSVSTIVARARKYAKNDMGGELEIKLSGNKQYYAEYK